VEDIETALDSVDDELIGGFDDVGEVEAHLADELRDHVLLADDFRGGEWDGLVGSGGLRVVPSGLIAAAGEEGEAAQVGVQGKWLELLTAMACRVGGS